MLKYNSQESPKSGMSKSKTIIFALILKNLSIFYNLLFLYFHSLVLDLMSIHFHTKVYKRISSLKINRDRGTFSCIIFCMWKISNLSHLSYFPLIYNIMNVIVVYCTAIHFRQIVSNASDIITIFENLLLFIIVN